MKFDHWSGILMAHKCTNWNTHTHFQSLSIVIKTEKSGQLLKFPRINNLFHYIIIINFWIIRLSNSRWYSLLFFSFLRFFSFQLYFFYFGYNGMGVWCMVTYLMRRNLCESCYELCTSKWGGHLFIIFLRYFFLFCFSSSLINNKKD